MSDTIDRNRWVFIMVQNPGEHEEYVGFSDAETNFIPAFNTKEEALTWSLNAPKNPEHKYEVQAILLEELVAETAQRDFKVYLLNQSGQTIEKY